MPLGLYIPLAHPHFFFLTFTNSSTAAIEDLYIDSIDASEVAAMDISEKRADGPLLPLINPGTHNTTQDASTIAAPSRSDKIYAAMETFNGTMERVSRSFDDIARFAMIARLSA